MLLSFFVVLLLLSLSVIPEIVLYQSHHAHDPSFRKSIAWTAVAAVAVVSFLSGIPLALNILGGLFRG